VQWRVLVPVRPDGTGKSRLRGATTDAALHADLVRAIQRDALAAVVEARELASAGSHDIRISGIHVVTSQVTSPITSQVTSQVTSQLATGFAPGIEVMADAGGGLNSALSAAHAELRRRHPADRVLAMVADLPSLRAEELLAVLQEAVSVSRGFVADHSGHGTTMLTSSVAGHLDPRFGPESAARHRESGAVELKAGLGASNDVDTADDLKRCLQLGVGASTAGMVAHLQPLT
jgi:2-phospho-L-lactate guanylyltransferase